MFFGKMHGELETVMTFEAGLYECRYRSEVQRWKGDCISLLSFKCCAKINVGVIVPPGAVLWGPFLS
jgi:hypothetical protein